MGDVLTIEDLLARARLAEEQADNADDPQVRDSWLAIAASCLELVYYRQRSKNPFSREFSTSGR